MPRVVGGTNALSGLWWSASEALRFLGGRSLLRVNHAPGRMRACRVRPVEEVRHVGVLEDPVHQPWDRRGCDASNSPQLCDAQPQGSKSRIFVQFVPVLAPHLKDWSVDPTLGNRQTPTLNRR